MAESEEARLKREAIEKRRALFMREEAVAEFIDDSPPEAVNAWQLTLRQLEDPNCPHPTHTARYIELVYRQPEGWSDGLTQESHEKLYDLALEVNLPTWLRMQQSTSHMLEKVAGILRSRKADSTGGTSLPTRAES